MDMQEMERILRETGLIPVVTVKDPATAVPLAQTLAAAGIRVMEITFRTGAAEDAIYAVSTQVPDLLVLAGTVVTVDQAKAAAATGADGIVTPGLDPEIVSWCQENGMPVFPGCATATEVQAAQKLGLHCVKLFPAQILGGTAMLKALHGPFGEMQFIPTGGIGPETLKGYLSLPYVLCCGGSWLCPDSAVEAGDFAAISQRTQAAMALVRRLRP